MPWNKYKENFAESRFWKFVLSKIRCWSHLIDIYAIDCIRLKSSNKMIGLWSPFKDKRILKEILEEKLDNYPSWSKYKNRPELREELKGEVRKKLSRLKKRYDFVISYTNVKIYYNCLEELSKEFDIIVLPQNVNWRRPRTILFQNINELVNKLQKIYPIH
jgi:hypothetical protein